ncbi:MAG: LegC family aminotransferase [Bacteroidetes bacterium]|nr:LegC family aminotransferase [Bacteroidota bacterium]MCA6442010.1 LegC family aminotransferase [Bacteroidota bacterium]
MIPLSVPNISGNEWTYIKECLDTSWVSSVGSYVDKFEQSLCDFTGAKHAVSTVNGSAALHISMLLAGVEQNDYVIVPNITFIASVNTITYLKASPILMDVDKDTWQMDLDLLEEFLSTKTVIKDNACIHKETNRVIRCVMPVHVLGNMCNMKRLMQIANTFMIKVVEDATESLGSYYNNQHSGTFGLFGCISFNGNKIITTGGGGMILTNDEKLAKRAKHITTQAKSDSFEYIHDEIGYNYRLVNILAAMGVAQMEQLPKFLIRKEEVYNLYINSFNAINGFKEQIITDGVKQNNWLQTFVFPDSKDLMKKLTDEKIQVRPFWVPMNQLQMFNKEIYVSINDIAGSIYNTCVSIPCSTGITNQEVEKVISSILGFYK